LGQEQIASAWFKADSHEFQHNFIKLGKKQALHATSKAGF